MQTVENIVKKIEELRQNSFNDLFGAKIVDLVSFLPYGHAKQYLKEYITEDTWHQSLLIKDEIISKMKDYMQFALSKAKDHRSLSASRSIDHYHTWLWVLEDDELLEFIEDEMNYMNYGVPILRAICTKYGIDFPAHNTALVNMSNGRPCCEDCEEGCGE